MSEKPQYTEFHPRWHRTRVSTYWWLNRGTYLVFILRELSSIFIAWFVIFTLMLVKAVSAGPEAYREFVAWTGHPVVILVNLATFFFVVFHAATWFNLAPKALVLRRKGQRVPDSWIAGANYGAWVVASVVVAWIILGG